MRAHEHTHVQVLMDKAAALRESLKPLAEAQGIRLSYLPIMLKVRPAGTASCAHFCTNQPHTA